MDFIISGHLGGGLLRAFHIQKKLESLEFDGYHCDVQLHQVYNTDVNFQHSLVEEPQC